MEFIYQLLEDLKYAYRDLPVFRQRLLIIIAILLLLGIAVGIYQKVEDYNFGKTFLQEGLGPPSGHYQLRNVTKKPIPREEFFRMIGEQKLMMCQFFNKDQKLIMECLVDRNKKARRCADQLRSNTPEWINNTTLSNEIAGKFKNCIDSD